MLTVGNQNEMFGDIIIDSFAGGGGASTGMELATGHPVDIAINHDESAIMMHRKNHPYTEHYREDIWAIDPCEVVRGRRVRLAWFSPDCKHFSRAKGKALVNRHIRGLAWVVLRWAAKVRPDVIMLENVPEFTTWGPVRKGKPVKSKAGQTYKRWYRQLSELGYEIQSKLICAADVGAPTIRTRFCLVARCDGTPIRFPERTHAPRNSPEVKCGKIKPWKSAAEIIDWSLPSYSIFETSAEIKEKYGVRAMRPLRENTLRRIARGLDKFVLKAAEPFIVPIGYGEKAGQAPRIVDINEPFPTVVASNKFFVADVKLAWLTKYYSGDQAQSIRDPFATVTTRDREGLVTLQCTYLSHFKGQDKGQDAREPLMTVTARDGQFGKIDIRLTRLIVTGHWGEIRKLLNTYCDYNLAEDDIIVLAINGSYWIPTDISLRMLTPRELYNAMGFPPDYIIDRGTDGNPISRADQVARAGNAVCPPLAEALVRANLPEECISKETTMDALREVMAG